MIRPHPGRRRRLLPLFEFVGWTLAAAVVLPAAPPSPLRNKLVEKLYSPVEREADFEDFATRAAAEKVPEQTIAEARLAFCLRTGNLDDHLVETVRELDDLCSGLRWRKDDSRLFNNPTAVSGALFFARALLAAKGGDDEEYERCIKEAFWRNPGMGPLLANELRTHRAWVTRVSKLTVPLDRPISDSTGRELTLQDLVKGKRALLLEFWAAWCDPSIDALDNLKERAARLAREDVVVVGLNVEDDRPGAEQVRSDKQIAFPWLVESRERPLGHLLGVDTIPHATLIAADGRVLFNGHPLDPALAEALEQLGVSKDN